MKKALFNLFLALSLVVVPNLVSAQVNNPNPVLPPDCTKITHNLKLGSTDATSGGDVTLLQEFLIANSYLSIPAPTGVFGVLTKAAVIDFQDSYNIVPASGFVFTITRATIEFLTCGSVSANLQSLIPVGLLGNNNNGSNNNLNPQNPSTPNNPGTPTTPTNSGTNLNTQTTFGNGNTTPLNTGSSTGSTNSGNGSTTASGQVPNANPNPNPANPHPNPNPNGSTTTLANPNNQPVKGCVGGPFNILTGAPCPNANPANPNPANPNNNVVPVPAGCPPSTVLLSPTATVPCNPCPANATPYVLVGTPNGGEKYIVGQQVNVLWRACNVPAGVDVSIDLLNKTNPAVDAYVTHKLVKVTANDGTELVTLTPEPGMPAFQTGTPASFKVRISYIFTSAYTGPANPAWAHAGDDSDDLFTIQ